jgi:hypothetical protein
MGFVRTLTIAAALCAHASAAHCAWMVDADGKCVRTWERHDLLRGPVAIVNAPFQPVRNMAAGAEYAWNKSEWGPWYKAVLGSAVIGVSGAVGMVEGAWWVGTGVADTLTGGYFGISPEVAEDRSVRPQQSAALAPSPPEPAVDHCGRPLDAAK